MRRGHSGVKQSPYARSETNAGLWQAEGEIASGRVSHHRCGLCRDRFGHFSCVRGGPLLFRGVLMRQFWPVWF